MDTLIKEFKAEANYHEVRKERVNSLLRSMCDTILISLGRVEVQFKIGPKLVIEYDKDSSKYGYTKDEGAEGIGRPEAVPAA